MPPLASPCGYPPLRSMEKSTPLQPQTCHAPAFLEPWWAQSHPTLRSCSPAVLWRVLGTPVSPSSAGSAGEPWTL